MRKKIEPRFPESLERLSKAIKAYGNNAKLARLTGLSVATIVNLTKEENPTRFPWSQTVEALWQVLPAEERVPETTRGVVKTAKSRSSIATQDGNRRARRFAKLPHRRASLRRITRPVRVIAGQPF